MKTQMNEIHEKFKSAPLKESAATKLDEIIRLTGVQKYRILQRLIEEELKRLQLIERQECEASANGA